MRTLRFRLMLWNALAVVLTGVGILLCVREGVRYTLFTSWTRCSRKTWKKSR